MKKINFVIATIMGLVTIPISFSSVAQADETTVDDMLHRCNVEGMEKPESKAEFFQQLKNAVSECRDKRLQRLQEQKQEEVKEVNQKYSLKLYNLRKEQERGLKVSVGASFGTYGLSLEEDAFLRLSTTVKKYPFKGQVSFLDLVNDNNLDVAALWAVSDVGASTPLYIGVGGNLQDGSFQGGPRVEVWEILYVQKNLTGDDPWTVGLQGNITF